MGRVGDGPSPEVLARLRAIGARAREPAHPPTPEELERQREAEAKLAAAAELWARFREPLLPEVPELKLPSFEPVEKIGPIDVRLVEDEAGKRPSPPTGARVFPHRLVREVVLLLAEGVSIRDAAQRTGLTRHDVSRIEHLRRGDHLVLTVTRGLRVDDLVGRRDRGYVLRLWDEQSGRWADPAQP
jgi:hypothetical protein